jgi:hypothetical protein
MSGAAVRRQVQRPLGQVFLIGALKMLGLCALGGGLAATGAWLFLRRVLPPDPLASYNVGAPLGVFAYGLAGASFGLMAGYSWAVGMSSPREGWNGDPAPARAAPPPTSPAVTRAPDALRGGERHTGVAEEGGAG